MNWKTPVFSLLVALPSLAGADAFRDANALYNAGKFADAAAAYEKIEPQAAHVYFNLGNAWFRQEQYGRAILNYERARRLAPRDPDILANLKFAEDRAGVTEVNRPSGAARQFWQSVLVSRTPREWSRYELAALWLTALGIGLWLWLSRYRSVWLVCAVIGCAGWAFSVAALVSRQQQPPAAVVLVARAEARFAPMPGATVHFALVEGSRVRVLEDRGDWMFVERADGQQGWVERTAIERLSGML